MKESFISGLKSFRKWIVTNDDAQFVKVPDLIHKRIWRSFGPLRTLLNLGEEKKKKKKKKNYLFSLSTNLIQNSPTWEWGMSYYVSIEQPPSAQGKRIQEPVSYIPWKKTAKMDLTPNHTHYAWLTEKFYLGRVNDASSDPQGSQPWKPAISM